MSVPQNRAQLPASAPSAGCGSRPPLLLPRATRVRPGSLRRARARRALRAGGCHQARWARARLRVLTSVWPRGPVPASPAHRAVSEFSLLRPLRLAVPPKAEYLLLWVAPDLLKLGQISTNLHSHLSSICKLRTGSGRGTSRTWSQGAKLRLLSPLRGHRA